MKHALPRLSCAAHSVLVCSGGFLTNKLLNSIRREHVGSGCQQHRRDKSTGGWVMLNIRWLIGGEVGSGLTRFSIESASNSIVRLFCERATLTCTICTSKNTQEMPHLHVQTGVDTYPIILRINPSMNASRLCKQRPYVQHIPYMYNIYLRICRTRLCYAILYIMH